MTFHDCVRCVHSVTVDPLIGRPQFWRCVIYDREMNSESVGCNFTCPYFEEGKE